MDRPLTGLGILLRRIDNLVGSMEAGIIGVSMILMAVNTIANVIGRYVLSQSIYFSEELNEILIVTVTFVGLGYVTRKGRHVRMSAIYDMFSEGVRRWLMVIIALTTAVAMFLLAWQAWEYIVKIAGRGRITPSLQIPLWTTYIGVVIGLILAGIQYLFTAWVNLTRRDGVWISFSERDDYQDPELSSLLELQKKDTEAEPLRQARS